MMALNDGFFRKYSQISLSNNTGNRCYDRIYSENIWQFRLQAFKDKKDTVRITLMK